MILQIIIKILLLNPL